MSNLTLINFTLYALGSMREDYLCANLLAFQVRTGINVLRMEENGREGEARRDYFVVILAFEPGFKNFFFVDLRFLGDVEAREGVFFCLFRVAAILALSVNVRCLRLHILPTLMFILFHAAQALCSCFAFVIRYQAVLLVYDHN